MDEAVENVFDSCMEMTSEEKDSRIKELLVTAQFIHNTGVHWTEDELTYAIARALIIIEEATLAYRQRFEMPIRLPGQSLLGRGYHKVYTSKVIS